MLLCHWMWVWSSAGFVQSSGTKWQWLQVWTDQSVLPPGKGTEKSADCPLMLQVMMQNCRETTKIIAWFAFLCLCACISLLSSTRSWSPIQITSQSCCRKSTRGWCAAAGRRSSGAACLSSNVGWLHWTAEAVMCNWSSLEYLYCGLAMI